MPQVISATHARNNFSDILSQVIYNQKEFIVEKKGKKVAFIKAWSDQKDKEYDDSGKKVLEALSNLNLKGGPKDLSINIDHYLYGGPKKKFKKNKYGR